MDRHEYMTTGEFASAMGVSKDTLFHYDDIGLFCPEKVSENGYRYYSIYQMETFDTIRPGDATERNQRYACASQPGAGDACFCRERAAD